MQTAQTPVTQKRVVLFKGMELPFGMHLRADQVKAVRSASGTRLGFLTSALRLDGAELSDLAVPIELYLFRHEGKFAIVYPRGHYKSLRCNECEELSDP